MNQQSIKIICTACGKETLLRRTPKYKGFKRIGEELSCMSCGHVFANEETIPFKQKNKMSVFTNEDKTPPIHIFDLDENKQLCRYCDHYVTNPFVQRCSYLKKKVEATDSCEHFAKKNVTAQVGTKAHSDKGT